MKSLPVVSKPDGTGSSTTSGLLATPSKSTLTLPAYSFSASSDGMSRKSSFFAAATLTMVGTSNAPAGTSSVIPSGVV